MAKYVREDDEILSADAEHPVSSRITRRGELSQMGVSCEGFQREVGVRRHTEATPTGGHKFCYTLSFYQHPGVRHELPLGCTPTGGGGDRTPPAPAEARRFAKALHRAAQVGYDPRNPPGPGGGGPRGSWWHRLVLPVTCGKPGLGQIRATLRAHGYWPRDAEIVPGAIDRDVARGAPATLEVAAERRQARARRRAGSGEGPETPLFGDGRRGRR